MRASMRPRATGAAEAMGLGVEQTMRFPLVLENVPLGWMLSGGIRLFLLPARLGTAPAAGHQGWRQAGEPGAVGRGRVRDRYCGLRADMVIQIICLSFSRAVPKERELG